MIVFWVFTLIGAVRLDPLDIDLDTDVDEDAENTLFSFYQCISGPYVLFCYNIIAQAVDTPMVCNSLRTQSGRRHSTLL